MEDVDKHKFQAADLYNVYETTLSSFQKHLKVVLLKGKHLTGSLTSAEQGTGNWNVLYNCF